MKKSTLQMLEKEQNTRAEWFSIQKALKARMPGVNSKFEPLTLKHDVWDFLTAQYERLGSDLGHISTLWEIPGEDEKELLVEHIANCVSGEKTSVIETFHKIRARVLYVTREHSPTDLLDDYLLECLLFIKFFVHQNGFIH